MQRLPLFIAFLLSGIAGISYELVWVRYVGRVVGHSTPAIAATVAFFLAGIALGAALFGKAFDRTRRPLLAYALLEATIGLLALAVPSALLFVERTLPGTASMPLSLLACGVVVLPPTTLLGATFPAMIRAVRALLGPVEGTARLYGLNTLGGMIGGLLAAFWLVPRFGYAATNLSMIAFNGAAALMLLWLHFRGEHPVGETNALAEAEAAAPAEVVAPCISYPAALAIAASTGFFAIAVEVLWVRALALSFPGTVYVFSVVLAAYLAGIGAGSLLLVPLSRRVGARPLLPLLYLFTALGVLASALLFPALTDLFFGLVRGGTINSWKLYIGGMGFAVFAAMIPATLAMGAALPLLIGLTSRESRSRDAGHIYAANVFGGTAGSLMTTFGLMPLLGLSRTLTLAATGYLLVGTLLTRLTTIRIGARQGLMLTTFAMGLGAVFGVHPDLTPAETFNKDHKLLYQRDAPSGTIAIHQRRQDGRQIRSLEVNNFYGLNETHPRTVAMQYRLGHLPLLLHPRPRKALLLGFATGSTLAAMAAHDLEQLDCVEIHADLLHLAPYFSHANHRVFEHPRVHLFAADGRRFLLAHDEAYDVIVSDLFLPRNPGVGALYSLEHFHGTRRRLKTGGIFVLWLPLWQLSPWETGVIVHTFLEVFPRATATLGNPSVTRPALALISPAPTKVSDGLESALKAHVRRSLQRAFGKDVHPSERGTMFQLSTVALQRWAADKPLNTLDKPVIEFSAPRTLMTRQLAQKRGGLATANMKYIGQLPP
ncbi:MAG: hypothetical protein JRH20_20910 [Deltaproteobacteria bacterium]|nr:hypothetical protein [Deltaproteobacteria bacterium]